MQNVDWMDGYWMYPLDCYDYQSTCGAENQQKVGMASLSLSLNLEMGNGHN